VLDLCGLGRDRGLARASGGACHRYRHLEARSPSRANVERSGAADRIDARR
jgi:hypothetical protein